ncbi:hypothetical protein B0H14DRAFT_2599287 [Mycena olivaceomarginata]|nr:hypothetical protein B0H14DRAFT_2599287 [Mycena olivaceomarginata]
MICRSFLLVLYALGPIPRCISAVLNPSAAPNASAVPNPSAVPNASAVPNPPAPPSPTGALPFLGPSGNWSTVVRLVVSKENRPTIATSCSVKLDPTQVVDQILHDTTGTTCSITLNFTGTAIYFFSAANTNPLVNLTFSLDGAFAGTSNIPDSTTQIPSVPMFQKTVSATKRTRHWHSTCYSSEHTSVQRKHIGFKDICHSFEGKDIYYSFQRKDIRHSFQYKDIRYSFQRKGIRYSFPRKDIRPSFKRKDICYSFKCKAELGGSLGGAIGLVALLAAAAFCDFYFMTVAPLLKISQAPGPAVDAGFDFVFTFPLPIKFRGKMLQDAQPAHLTLTNKKPESGFTLAGSTSTSHEPVAWKVLTLFARQEGQSVRLPRDLGFGDVEDSGGKLANSFFNFAPLRTLVTRTTSTAWRSARFIIPGLAAMVVANNAAPEPVDFALGTYHAKKDEMNHNFYPFVVIRGVLNSQFCVAPQCEELVVNAYITQNIDERQLLTGLFDSANSDTNRPIPDRTSDAQKEPNAAPRPTIEEDDEDDRSPKILSGALMGENGEGRLVSTLEQKTKWHLVDDSQDLRLKIVSDAEA